jgi:hypothetical protein
MIPATSAYISTLPSRHVYIVTGIGRTELIKVILLIGAEQMMSKLQLLHQPATNFKILHIYQRITLRLDSIHELETHCPYKYSKTSHLSVNIRINTQPRQDLCAYCGEMTEFSAFVTGVNNNYVLNTENPGNKKQELSHQYCINHRPKLKNGKWNPAYRTAKRSFEQFNIELSRLINQSFENFTFRAQSGDPLVDQYFFIYILKNTLHPTDESELRNIARRMVDSKLSDNKKKILVLKKAGLNQTEIANRLQGGTQKSLSRQTVSRLLASIRKEFKL